MEVTIYIPKFQQGEGKGMMPSIKRNPVWRLCVTVVHADSQHVNCNSLRITGSPVMNFLLSFQNLSLAL